MRALDRTHDHKHSSKPISARASTLQRLQRVTPANDNNSTPAANKATAAPGAFPAESKFAFFPWGYAERIDVSTRIESMRCRDPLSATWHAHRP
jgi:hypothetical protein